MSAVAARYAKSLIEVAQEQGKLDEVNKDIAYFKEVAALPDFSNMLNSPIISSSKKMNVFKAVFDGKVSTMTNNFFNVVVSKGREAALNEIAQSFTEQYEEINKITTVKLRTAVDYSQDILDSIKSKLIASQSTLDNIVMDVVVDKSLIGGYVVEFGDKVYDASVKHQLDRLYKQF